MAESDTVTLPATHQRPRDRRRQILLNASELFAQRGYHAVRMEDIAEATGVTARAIYRHFTNKQDLLSHVILEDQDRLLAAIEPTGSAKTSTDVLQELLVRLVDASLESLRLGPLWQREARHLVPEDFERVREGTRRIGRSVRVAIEQAYPDHRGFRAEMRAWMAISIITSPGHSDPPLPRRRLSRVLLSAAQTAITTPGSALLPNADRPPAAAVHGAADRPASSRREQIITAAARAFRERGFGGVSLDEFGIAGPAVYRYFESKADILCTLINRVQEWMALESSRATSRSPSDNQVIDALVRGYVRVATEFPDLLAVSVTEALNLPERAAEREKRIRQDDLAEWVKWLRTARTDLAEPDAYALINAVRTLINDLIRVPHLLQHKEFQVEVIDCSINVLLSTPVPATRSAHRLDGE